MIFRRTVSTLCLSLALVGSFAPTAQGATGRTPGNFTVSPDGATNYTIPIWVPPGPRGLQPHLALAYNSRAGGGPVGPGWFLAGISSIARCNKTFAQDTTPAPVTLTYSDAFCLDGQRLRITSGGGLATYGQDLTTYQTEIANFSNVTAHGVAGNGPATFTVQGKDGLTYEYGNGGNSRVLADGTTASIWLLDKVTDRGGNTMTIAYLAPSATLTGTTGPDTISWTPSGDGLTTYNYTMKFTYNTANTPASSIFGYVSGTPVVNQDLLLNVEIKNGTTTVKKYVLTYGTSPTTGATRLTQVKECADTGATNCLLPTAIGYQNGTTGIATTATTVASNGVFNLHSHYDLNGDGFPDLIYTDQNSTATFVRLGSATGFGAAINANIVPGSLIVGDLLGNGKDGILADSAGTLRYSTWNGSSFTSVSTGVSSANAATLADVNGDGLPDLVFTEGVVVHDPDPQVPDTLQFHVKTLLNTSSSGTVSFNSTLNDQGIITCFCSAFLFSPDTATLRRWDFNGDGRDDLALRTISSSGEVIHYLVSNGTGFNDVVAFSSNTQFQGPQYIDWNNDACTDAAFPNQINVSGCDGSAPVRLTVTAAVQTAMDWDSDGRTDLIVNNGGTIGVYLSTGNGVSALQSTSIPFSVGNYFSFDANGDGQHELGFWNTGIASPSLTYYAHNGTGTPPDLVSSITDGYSNSFSPAYISIARDASYTKGTGAVYPEKDIEPTMYVVDQTTLSDGIGGTYVENYTYTGARENLQGRGFEGFQTFKMSDNRAASLVRTLTFQTAFPFTGTLSQDDTFQHNGTTLVSHAVYTNNKTDLSTTANNQRQFVFRKTENIQRREVGGSQNALLIDTTATTNTFDNFGNATNVATTVTDNDAISPYVGQVWSTTTAMTITPNTANWCLGLPTHVTVTKDAPGATPAITRTVDFTPDYPNCRPTQKITEPAASTTYKVTEDYTYDVFGNLKTITVTGVGMTARVTTLDWGTTGQFPMSVKNALNQPTTLGYDFNFGLLNSVTDPNTIPTTAHYDAFGRKDTETRPDGTKTTWAYNDCATSGGCLIGTHALALVQTVFNVGGTTVQTDGTTYFDPLDRVLITKKRLLASGSYDRNEVRYDKFGNVINQYMPCTFSAVTTACTFSTTNTYDALNRLTQSQRPMSATDSTPQNTTIAYAGRTTTTTDAQNKETVQVTTVAGTLGRTEDHNGYFQNFTYDSFNSLLGVADSLGNTLFTATYDYGLGAFQRDATDMDLDLSTAAGQHRHYNYDALGELTSWSDAKGQNFLQTYDVLSRPLVRTEPDLVTTNTWGNSAAIHNIGQLASVSAGTYSENFGFDAVGRLATHTVTIPSDASYIYSYAYSATTGLLDTLTYPVSTSSYQLKLQYTYVNGILQKVSDFNAPTTVFWTANAANPRGQVTQETLGNGVVTNRAFDAVTGWLSSLQSGVGGGAALQNESYLFDLVGNVTQRQNNNPGLTENFFYDNVYRLDHSQLGGVTNLQMTYDALGNITKRTDVAGNATWTYDPVRKHAVTQAGDASHAYSYDNNGNMQSRSGLTISWTSFNHPNTINGTNLYDGSSESVSFAYDQDHEHWKVALTTSAGLETTYLIGGLLEKVLVAGTPTEYRHYIYAGGTKVALYSRDSAGTNILSYVREDHEGSVAALLNSDGTSFVKESFTAFGLPRSACSWKGNPTSGNWSKIRNATPQGYTWQRALGSMGLNDMHGRVQDAVTGRFLSVDPYVAQPLFTQNYNRYSYVNNNPLSYTDPSGFADAQVPLTHCNNGCLGGSGGGSSGGGSSGLQEVVVSATAGDSAFGSAADGFADAMFTMGNAKTPDIPGANDPESLPEVVVTARKTHKPITHPTPTVPVGWLTQGEHKYEVDVPLGVCVSPKEGFDVMRNFAAPGGGHAQDGTRNVELLGGNWIQQTVDPVAMTITNVAIPGKHVFGGSVSISIYQQNGVTGAHIVGSGIGPNAAENQFWGPKIFEALGAAAFTSIPCNGVGAAL